MSFCYKSYVNMKNIYHFICTFLFFFTTSLSGQGLLTEQAALPCIDRQFTVVTHIVRDTFGDAGITEMEILDAIDSMNIYFAPICVSFKICEFRYIDNFQYDIVSDEDWAEMQVKYHLDNRINMYIVADIDDASAVCGFASLGGITQMESGGIVIKKECVGFTKTIPHEFGHYFNLMHTFEGSGSELVDGSNCTTEGDEVCDTPADPFEVGDDMSLYIGGNCRFISPKQDANGQYYEPDVGNIMSYYPGDCSCGFTYQQYLRMANTYLSMPDMW